MTNLTSRRPSQCREEKQHTEGELSACQDARAAVEQQLAAQQAAAQKLEADRAALAADLAAKQEALQAALARCEAAEVSCCAAFGPAQHVLRQLYVCGLEVSWEPH